MSSLNLQSSNKEYNYFASQLLSGLLGDKDNVVSSAVKQKLETGTFEEVFQLKDGRSVEFRFIDFDGDGQASAQDRIEIIKYTADGETQEAYDTGDSGSDALGDCEFNHSVQDGDFVFKKEHCPD